MGMWCRVCGLGTSWLALLMCDYLLVCFIVLLVVMDGIDGLLLLLLLLFGHWC